MPYKCWKHLSGINIDVENDSISMGISHTTTCTKRRCTKDVEVGEGIVGVYPSNELVPGMY